MKPYTSYWGNNLRVAEVPQAVFDGDLDSNAIAVLAVLLDLEKATAARQKKDTKKLTGSLPPGWSYPAFCRVKRTTLQDRTGYSRNIVTAALRKLRQAGWMNPVSNHRGDRRKAGKFGCATYTLTRPGSLLEGSINPVALKRTAQGNLLWGNGVKYCTFPRVVLTATDQAWSLAKMASAESRLYFAMCYLANNARSLAFRTSLRDLGELTRMEIRTVLKHLPGLRFRGLIWADGADGMTAENWKEHRDTSLLITLCNPKTGQPIHAPCDVAEADDANYRVAVKGVSCQAVFNLSPEQTEKLIRELVSGTVITQSNGDLMICCPFHPDDTPSLSVSPSKRGCWQCFGGACPQKSGNFSQLIMGLTGCSRVQSMERIGKAVGHEVHFQRPDSDAVAIYRYRDEGDTRTLKEVIRYPNLADGTKDIRQRQPVAGGYRWDVQDVGPLLYNVHRLKMGGVAVVCEGEKDCDSITNLGLWGQGTIRGNGPVIGVTSGSANSWDASLTEHLRLMNVVLMPDDDEAGRKYAEAIKASLDAEGIECREVSFAGTGCKDASEFLERHSVDDLVQLIGSDWVRTGADPALAE